MAHNNETQAFSSMDSVGGSDTVLFTGGSEGFHGGDNGNFLQDGTRVTFTGDESGNFLSDSEKQAFDDIVMHFGKVALLGGEELGK